MSVARAKVVLDEIEPLALMRRAAVDLDAQGQAAAFAPRAGRGRLAAAADIGAKTARMVQRFGEEMLGAMLAATCTSSST